MLVRLTALVVLIIDQLTKTVVLTHIADGGERTVIPGVLVWELVRNTHGAYGFFGGKPILLILLAAVALAIIWFSFRDRARSSALFAVALGLVMGGAVGNILDRVHYGFVVDFIHIVPVPLFEVFNVADSGITVGIVIILLASFFGSDQAARDAIGSSTTTTKSPS